MPPAAFSGYAVVNCSYEGTDTRDIATVVQAQPRSRARSWRTVFGMRRCADARYDFHCASDGLVDIALRTNAFEAGTGTDLAG